MITAGTRECVCQNCVAVVLVLLGSVPQTPVVVAAVCQPLVGYSEFCQYTEITHVLWSCQGQTQGHRWILTSALG